MVPVSVRKADERGTLNNQVSAVFVDLPVGDARPGGAADRASAARWTSTRSAMQAVDAQLDHRDGRLRRAGAARPRACGPRCRPGQFVVPGGDHQRARPAVPALRARQADGLGARLRADRRRHPLLHRHLQLPEHDDVRASTPTSTRFPDVDVLSGGIRRGLDELLALAKQPPTRPRPTTEASRRPRAAPAKRRHPAKQRRRAARRRPRQRRSSEPGTARRGGARRRAARDADEPGLTVAVTGPTGTFGSGLIPLLQADDRIARIIGIARRPFDPAERGWTKMEYRQGDVRDPDGAAARRSTAPTSSCTWRS